MTTTILGLAEHPQAACFVEIADAVSALTDRDVVLNAHTFEAPPGSVVYNFENAFQVEDPRELWKGHEVWDFNKANAAKYGATYVPIGYHVSMERFARAKTQDIDVIFTGCMNERRRLVLQELGDRGLNVVVVPPGIYGAQRDALLARSKLALNMLFYEDGVFPALRVAHLVANHVPVLSERCDEDWSFLPTCAYGDLVDRACAMVTNMPSTTYAYEMFRRMPMTVPS